LELRFLVNKLIILKGQGHEIFTSGFFIKLLLLAPRNMPGNDFYFFRIFGEIFDNFGTSPVLIILAKQALPMSLTGEKYTGE
jgi:hypothetical protein